MKKEIWITLPLFFIFVIIGFLGAVSVFVAPSSITIEQGNSFLVEVRGTAPLGDSDVYGIQFDLNYNPSVLSVNSIVEGSLLNADSEDTIFNYTLTSGKIDDIYIVRNVTNGSPNAGINTDEGVFAIINFTASGVGTSLINLSDVIWVNSTITNNSAGSPSVMITDGNYTINSSTFCGDAVCNSDETCSTCEADCGTCNASSFCGDGTCDSDETCSTCEADCGICPTSSSSSTSSGGGGGGGGTTSSSSGGAVVNVENSSSTATDSEETPSEDSGAEETPTEPEPEGSSITGGIINDIFGGNPLSAITFYFVMAILISVVSFYLIRRIKQNKGLKRKPKKISEY